MDDVPVSKTEDQELPVPSDWRPAFKALADAIVLDTTFHPIEGFVISSIEDERLQISRGNIRDYPDKIGPLSQDSWKSSIYVWDERYWAVLVDLTTDKGDVSDLVLHAKVTERGDEYLIEFDLVYVP